MKYKIQFVSSKGARRIVSEDNKELLFSNKRKVKQFLRNRPFKYKDVKILDAEKE